MRTSLNEIKEIEHYLLKLNRPEDRLLFKVKLVLDDELRVNTLAQKEAYKLIQLEGRATLRSEIARIEAKVFYNPMYKRFQKIVQSIFN